MPTVDDLIGFLDDLLDARAFPDFGPNGLQVPGRREVESIATGVSAHGPLFAQAAAAGAGLVLVHHGLFWRGQPLQITPAMHRRLKLLFDHDIALGAYHLPLDAHPEHGNNALIAQGLDGIDPQPFAEHGGRAIGVHVRFGGDGLTLDELDRRVAALCGQEPLVIAGGEHGVRSLGIVSGAATDDVHEAVALGLDAFLTGEPAERAFGIARDDGIHFLAAGHHATETFGIRRVGDLLAQRFGVTHVHLDVRNPI
jgi:dinuclear metal center YbgI/SA1388 family protein